MTAPFASMLVAQSTTPESGGGLLGLLVALTPLVVAAVALAGVWKVFTKAGQPGWAALIPIYNLVVLLRIAGRPLWWILLVAIPVVNCVVAIVVAFDIARSFGKGTGFALGLAFLGFVCYPLLGFSDARYRTA